MAQWQMPPNSLKVNTINGLMFLFALGLMWICLPCQDNYCPFCPLLIWSFLSLGSIPNTWNLLCDTSTWGDNIDGLCWTIIFFHSHLFNQKWAHVLPICKGRTVCHIMKFTLYILNWGRGPQITFTLWILWLFNWEDFYKLKLLG